MILIDDKNIILHIMMQQYEITCFNLYNINFACSGMQGGSGADSRSLFGPDGKRYGANLIEEADRWGYEANIPGATSRFIGYRSANGSKNLSRQFK